MKLKLKLKIKLMLTVAAVPRNVLFSFVLLYIFSKYNALALTALLKTLLLLVKKSGPEVCIFACEAVRVENPRLAAEHRKESFRSRSIFLF